MISQESTTKDVKLFGGGTPSEFYIDLVNFGPF